MLNATEMRVVSDVAKSALKRQSVEKTQIWCEARENDIVYAANRGLTITNVGVPKGVINDFFTKDERDTIITTFFEELGYKVKFQNGFVLEW